MNDNNLKRSAVEFEFVNKLKHFFFLPKTLFVNEYLFYISKQRVVAIRRKHIFESPLTFDEAHF